MVLFGARLDYRRSNFSAFFMDFADRIERVLVWLYHNGADLLHTLKALQNPARKMNDCFNLFGLIIFLMILIKRVTLEGLLQAARNTYPNEFFALLGSKHRNEVIDEVIVVPAIYGRAHALIKSGYIPVDFNIVGSVHSHPTHSNKPSKADLHSFPAFGKIHLIISYPFTMESINAYDSSGRKTGWRVVE